MANTLKCVLALNHGQAGVEWGFSLQTDLLKDKMEANLLNYWRIMKDHMLLSGMKPDAIVIATKLLLSVKGSRNKYEAAEIIRCSINKRHLNTDFGWQDY